MAVDSDPTARTTASSASCSCRRNTTIPGPGQVQNNFETDPSSPASSTCCAAGRLAGPLRQPADAAVRRRPVYVEPVYIQRGDGGQEPYPILQRSWCRSATRSARRHPRRGARPGLRRRPRRRRPRPRQRKAAGGGTTGAALTAAPSTRRRRRYDDAQKALRRPAELGRVRQGPAAPAGRPGEAERSTPAGAQPAPTRHARPRPRRRSTTPTGSPPRRAPSRRVASQFAPAPGPRIVLTHTDAGWSSSVARWAHNPEVAGSNPAPATSEKAPRDHPWEPFISLQPSASPVTHPKRPRPAHGPHR